MNSAITSMTSHNTAGVRGGKLLLSDPNHELCHHVDDVAQHCRCEHPEYLTLKCEQEVQMHLRTMDRLSAATAIRELTASLIHPNATEDFVLKYIASDAKIPESIPSPPSLQESAFAVYGARFSTGVCTRRQFTLEDAIEFHTFAPLEALPCM
jgi:hypothetical protein